MDRIKTTGLSPLQTSNETFPSSSLLISDLHPLFPPVPNGLTFTMTTWYCTEALQTKTSVISGVRLCLTNHFLGLLCIFVFNMLMLFMYKMCIFHDHCFVYSLFHVMFSNLCYVPKNSFHTWGAFHLFKDLTPSSLLVIPFIFLSFINLFYYIRKSKVQIWRYRHLSGRRANHAAASYKPCLQGGGTD